MLSATVIDLRTPWYWPTPDVDAPIIWPPNLENAAAIDAGGGPDVHGAGWSFGFCLGYCCANLELDGDVVVVIGRSQAGEDLLYVNRGSLTDEGRARLDEALAMVAARMQPTEH